jgi:2-polyprenyl-6-hydroxyphenyl methylase/3-demethylubiquinone-9 3-methyltransferase
MSNVDAQELAKFSDLAHKWWDPESEFRPLHEINPLRLDWIERCAGPLAGRSVVDIGCGGGILSEAMARQGARVLGIDLAERSLKVAQLHALEAGVSNLEYREVAAESLADQRPASFDVVTCMEMMEHVPLPSSIVEACARLVRPGSWVFFSTINRNARSWLHAIVGAEYLLKLLPAGTHDHARFIRPHELAAWCRGVGLDLRFTKGMGYNPVTRRYALDDDTRVNYLVACQKAG